MDMAHATLIAATVWSMRPARVLELGIGTGYLTKALLLALRSNGGGALISVDNWFDWDGRRPEHITELEELGAQIVESSEEAFVGSYNGELFNVIISDADHYSSDRWFEQTLALMAPGGVAFFHDTQQPSIFPGLATLPQRAVELNLACRHFTASSEDDRCHRGLLMVLNGRG